LSFAGIHAGITGGGELIAAKESTRREVFFL